MYFLDTTRYVTSNSSPDTNNVHSRIVGGTRAKISEVPYQLSMEIYGGHFCGAVMISSLWVLTAGHCFTDYLSVKLMQIRSGTDQATVSGEVHEINQIVVHENYPDQGGSSNPDIAVVQVKTKFSYMKGVQEPIPMMPSGTEIAAGTMGLISGWGVLHENHTDLPVFLHKAYVPVLSFKDCNWQLNGMAKGQICAGYWQGGIDACFGDSGGPLVVENKLAGIVSWGIGCARPRLPGVYTDVAFYRDWVRQNTDV